MIITPGYYRTQVILDFIGYHVNQNEAIDFEESRNDRFLLAKDYIKEKTTKLKNYLKQLHIEKPLHLTYMEYVIRKYTIHEWNIFPWCISNEKCVRNFKRCPVTRVLDQYRIT